MPVMRSEGLKVMYREDWLLLPACLILAVVVVTSAFASTSPFGAEASERANDDGIAILQVDSILYEKLEDKDVKAVQQATDALKKAHESVDEKQVDAAERALKRLEDRLSAKRRRVVVGRVSEAQLSQNGLSGGTITTWRQVPCAVLFERGDKKVDQIKMGDFVSITRVDSKVNHSDRGPREMLQALVDEPILNGFTRAVVAKAWKVVEKPSKWPEDVCDTPWLAPSAALTAEAKLEVTVLPEKLVYEFRDCVQYVLKIRNGGDQPIKSANIWFVFRGASGEVVQVQRYWTNDQGLCIVEPRIKDLDVGGIYTIQTFATKVVDLQTKSIDVVVLSLSR